MQQRLDRWEARAEWPLASVAAVFLAAYSVEVLVQPHGVAARFVELATLVTWAVFTADYAARLYLAPTANIGSGRTSSTWRSWCCRCCDRCDCCVSSC